MKPIGGTELLYNNLIKYTGTDWAEYVNLIISVCYQGLIDPTRSNIVWQHLSYDQQNIIGMIDRNFINLVDKFVYVSEWQKNQFQNRFPVDESKNLVIRNAIEDIEFKHKPTDKIRLIYTSMPNRGLEILLDAFELLNRNDVELIVYSSNIIYGKGYATNSHIEQLFHRCRTMKNVIYKGFGMNQAVRYALQQSHILAYPSIYEETSCLSAIEAGAAGCRIVTTNYGALSETCGEHATYVDYSDDRQELTHNYSNALNDAINNYSSEGLLEQSDWFNLRYSWNIRKTEWNKFFGELCVK